MFNKIIRQFIYIIVLFAFSFVTASIEKIPNVNIKSIKEKEDCYTNLFDTKRKIKKATIISTATLGTIFLSYLGFDYWQSLPNKKTKQKNEEIDIKKLKKTVKVKKLKKSLNKNDSLGKAIKHESKKTIKKSVKTIISLGVLYIISDVLKPVKDKIIDFFKLNDEKHFERISFSLTTSLKQLKEIFLLESPMCNNEELIDHYSFFIENAENFIAFLSAIANKKNISFNNYQALANQQETMFKNIFKFSENLNLILNNDNEIFFDENMSEEILPIFKQVNNQIFRFLQLSQAILYES